MSFNCEHCGGALGFSPAADPSKVTLRGTVVVKDGHVETTCPHCKEDTRLPLRYVATSLTSRRILAP